jgi:hypothetical protein
MYFRVEDLLVPMNWWFQFFAKQIRIKEPPVPVLGKNHNFLKKPPDLVLWEKKMKNRRATSSG